MIKKSDCKNSSKTKARGKFSYVAWGYAEI